MKYFLASLIHHMKKENDPVYYCPVYNSIGCSQVDGMLCDFPECSIIKEYENVR